MIRKRQHDKMTAVHVIGWLHGRRRYVRIFNPFTAILAAPSL